MSTLSNIDPIATEDYLRNTKEYQYLERKGIDERGVSPSKLANEIIGMLNADGGIIALGISDDGVVQDLNEVEENMIQRYEKVCQEFVKPPANVKLEKVTFPNGELVFLYHVAQDYEDMYSRKDNDNTYKRVSDSNYGPLNNDEIDKLRHDKSLRRFEEKDRSDFNPADLDTATLEKYKDHIKYDGTLEELLIKRNLASEKDNKLVYKNSAILLFSKDPDKYIPSSYIRYIRYEGAKAESGKNFNVTKDVRLEGNIPKLIDSAKEFIFASLDDFYFLDMKTGRFVSISEYPEEAWLEGLVNAMFHRSYNLQGNCVYIKHFDDRLEISNSGPLPAQVTVENIRTQRFSRNPRIGRVLSEMGYVRELNEGVNRIYSSMEESMLSEPEYTDISDTVTLKLINKVSKHKKTVADHIMKRISEEWSSYNETERLLLQCLLTQFTPTISNLSKFCGVSEKAVRGYINNFIKKGMVTRESEKQRDKNARYSFRKDT
jgi:ATP-dependent DNA helicase RecG